MSSGTSAKGVLYAQSLDQARRHSLWTQAHPVDTHGKVILHSHSGGAAAAAAAVTTTAANASNQSTAGSTKEVKDSEKHMEAGMDWTELLRKFVKHNPHREVTAAAARTEQTVHVLLSRSAQTARYNPDQSHENDGSHANQPSWAPLVRSEDQAIVRTALESLGNAIRLGQNTTNNNSSTSSSAAGSSSVLDKQNAWIVRAFAWYSIGEFQQALSDLAKVDRRSPRDQAWERYDWVLSVVCHAIEGFACERLSRSTDALRAYNLGSKAHEEASKALAAGNSGGGVRTTIGIDEVELRNWGEMILFRLSLRSAATSSAGGKGSDAANKIAMNAHRLYVKNTQTWPTRFRPAKAMIIHQSYRQLLHSTYPSPVSNHQQNQTHHQHHRRSALSPPPPALVQWYDDVAANNMAQEKILQNSTKLPKAGSTNKKYLNFLDEVAASWRVSGSGKMGAAQVVQIMYNALTHTFQSQRLLRYLARALVADGSYEEAGKTLKLYLDLFDKARETDAAQVAKDLRRLRRHSESGTTLHQQPALEEEKAPGTPGSGEELDSEDHDIDGDRDFIRTMVFGSRLFCKYLNDPQVGLEMARRARVIFDEKKDESLASDKVEESRIEQALGSSLGALTAKDADLETRPLNHQLALQHLENAEALDPSSWDTLYHLAYQLAELRQITPALDRARQAVELNGSSRDAWHLLGLLVAAQKDLGASLQVIETTLDDEEEEEDIASRQGSTNGLASPADLSSHGSVQKGNGGVGSTPAAAVGMETGTGSDYAPPIGLAYSTYSNGATQVNGNNSDSPSLSQVDSKLSKFGLSSNHSENRLPSNAVVATTSDFSYYRNALEVLESEIQIRMTKCVIIEAMEGPEAALQDQQSVLQYFSSTFASLKDIAESSVSNVASAPNPTLPNSVSGGEALLNTTTDKAAKRSSSILGRKKSLRNLSGNQSVTTDSSRNVSNASALAFNDGSSTAAASTYQSSTRTVTAPTLENSPKATKLLIDLWLMSAASFRRAGKLDEARGAIQEAENLSADDPDVWSQLALYALAKSDFETARVALVKAQSFSLTHIPSIIVLARLYLSQGSNRLPFAEGLLDALTKMHGWDVPEAWFELSRCYKGTPGRSQREKECLVWALQLEETKSVRKLQDAVPRWI